MLLRAFISGFILLLPTWPASAAEPALRTITVQGEGEVFAEPDLLLTSFYVVAQGKDVKALKANVDAKVAQVKALLEQLGVDGKDYRIMQFHVNPQYDWQAGRKFLGYEVRRDIEIRLKQIDQFGKLLDGAVAAGVNHTGHVELANGNRAELETDAASLAVRAARKRAQTLAEAGGARLGRVLTIQESGVDFIAPQPRMQLATLAMAEAAPVENAGTNVIKKSVTVVFELQ